MDWNNGMDYGISAYSRNHLLPMLLLSFSTPCMGEASMPANLRQS